MALAGTIGLADPRGKPWRVMGTPMPPQVLLMGKLLFLLLLYHGFPGKIRDPFIPFISSLDGFLAWPGLFETVLLTCFYAAGLFLLLNIAVRRASLLLGIVLVLTLLASKPVFRNHLFITGCLFLLAGLHKKDEHPWLLYLQFSIIYFGASLNKALDPDWHTGQFMHTWLLDRRANPFYTTLAPMLPQYTLAMFLSWFAIGSEAAAAILFAIGRTRVFAVWLTLLFHWTLFVLLRGAVFGHFLEDILIALILFLAWPRGEIVATMRASIEPRLGLLIRSLDWDRRIRFERESETSTDSWLLIEVSGLPDQASQSEPRRNGEALQYLIRYSTGLYAGIFVLYHLMKALIPPPLGFALIVSTGAMMMLLFAPTRWWRLLKSARE